MDVNTNIQPRDIIDRIRESFYGSEHVYTQGSCYQLFLILKEIFPRAAAWSNGEHVITFIETKFYDISGQVIDHSGYKPIKLNDIAIKTKFDFWNCGLECPTCDDMICYSGLKISATYTG